jgi:hypothetical protein
MAALLALILFAALQSCIQGAHSVSCDRRRHLHLLHHRYNCQLQSRGQQERAHGDRPLIHRSPLPQVRTTLLPALRRRVSLA